MYTRFPLLHESEINNPVPDQIINDCINGAVNDEVKLLETALFYSQHHEAQSGTAIANAINQAQGSPQAKTFYNSYVREHCVGSLEQIAHVVDSAGIDFWQASQEYAGAKLALVGFVGHWSLQHPDLPLRGILGATKSLHGKYAPEFRFKLYETMIAVPNGLSVQKLSQLLPGEKPERITGHVNQLTEAGFFVKDSVRGQNPAIRVNSNLFSKGAIGQLLPESRALYMALEEIPIGTDITLNQLLDRAVAINPDINSPLLRRRILGCKGNDWHFPGLELDSEPVDTEHLAIVAIAPSVLHPITAFHAGIKNIREGIELETYIEMAKEFVGSQTNCRDLVEKSRAFAAKRPAAQVMGEIVSILRSHGECTLEELHVATEKHIQQASLRRYLGRLVTESRISLTYDSKGPHRQKSVRKYSVDGSE